MKLSTLLTCFILFSYYLSAQKKDTTILIIPCKSGELIIDGISKGKIEAEDAHKEQIEFGDHYFQLKTDDGKVNSTINISETLTSTIIKLGCESKSTELKNSSSVRLLDKMVSLSGSMSNNTENSYFGMDEGDELNIQCEILNKKGTANLSIIQVENGMDIYRKADFNSISNEKVRIPKKAVYRILLTTNALFGKEARLVLDRIPSSKSSSDFKTTVHFKADTTAQDLGTSSAHVFSINHGTTNKTVLRLSLPAGTTYWTYWIGVGQESQNKMKSFASTLSGVGNLLSANPLFLFGMKLIPQLPMLNVKSTISYCFMDSRNSQLFLQNNPQARMYSFKYASNVSTDYAIVNHSLNDITLCLKNDSMFIGQDVEVRVVAFIVNSHMEMD